MTSSAAVRIRVLTFNIHHGEGLDGKFDLPRLARVITNATPDIVALQEVDKKTRRANGVDQAAVLGELTGMRVVFGKAMEYGGGEYGVALLSRWPMLETRNESLPGSSGREPRTFLSARFSAGPNGPIFWFSGTHLDHLADAADRVAQAFWVKERVVEKEDGPRILAGDLNAVPESRPMEIFFEDWVDGAAGNPQPTVPAEHPRSRIDYVLYRPGGSWKAVEARVLEEGTASDHRPLLVVLEWVGG